MVRKEEEKSPMQADITEQRNKPNGYYDSVREDMLKYIPEDAQRTVEFGCGSGGFSALIKDRLGAKAWAVEIDEKSAKTASEKLDKVLNCDAHEAIAKLPDDYFDCIIFFDILEHLVDPYSLLTSVKKKLTKKGVVTASIPNIRYYSSFVKYVIHGNWDYRNHGILDKTHLRFFTYKSIVKMFNNLDFEILEMEGIHPTSSRTFRLLNMLFLNALSDIKYKHFAIVAKPKETS
jgi:2-polyprenyl-3-methyl-5-hydroxy-6-metoxy-1,4-benzoquinol methylase